LFWFLFDIWSNENISVCLIFDQFFGGESHSALDWLPAGNFAPEFTCPFFAGSDLCGSKAESGVDLEAVVTMVEDISPLHSKKVN